MNQFLDEVVLIGQQNYVTYGGTSPKKLHSLHGWMNNEIKNNVHVPINAMGYGLGSGQEKKVVNRFGQTKKADGYFGIRTVGRADVPDAPGAIVEYKWPMSSLNKNIDTDIASVIDISQKMRSEGWAIGFVLMIAERTPIIRGNAIEGWDSYRCSLAKMEKSFGKQDSGVDFAALICYSLPDLDYNSITTREQWENAIYNYNGVIKFCEIPDSSYPNIIINDPSLFAVQMSNLIDKRGEGHGTCVSYTTIFEGLSQEVQKEALEKVGALSTVNENVYKILMK